MKSNLNFQNLKSDLISLGFSFYGEPSSQPADPEETLIKALAFFYEDRKVFRTLLRWTITVSPLLHVERLHKRCEQLDSKFVPVLGALSKKLVLAGDRRFKLIYEDMKKRTKYRRTKYSIPEGYADAFLISKYGEDKELKAFGIKVAKIEPEGEKKLLPLRDILRMHRWLKIRTLVGANFRADLIYWITQKAIANPNQATKALGCSRETAYRLWREVSLYDGLEKLTT